MVEIAKNYYGFNSTFWLTWSIDDTLDNVNDLDWKDSNTINIYNKHFGLSKRSIDY